MDNVGPTESKVRITLGIVLIVMGLLVPLPEVLQLSAMSIGILSILPGFFGFCPIKAVFVRGQKESA